MLNNKASHGIFTPYAATEDNATLETKLENMVILNTQNDETKHGSKGEGSHTPAEKSMIGKQIICMEHSKDGFANCLDLVEDIISSMKRMKQVKSYRLTDWASAKEQ